MRYIDRHLKLSEKTDIKKIFGDMIEKRLGGWENISKRAREGCEGARDKSLFYKYCLNDNCTDCPYKDK
jgi:hypothetical protein